MKTLASKPCLEFLRREARTLKSKHKTLDISTCKIIGHFDTSFHRLTNDEIFARKFSILDAQRVTARQYGFASCKRLKLFIQKSTTQSTEFDPVLRCKLLRRKSMHDALLKRAKKKKTNTNRSYERFVEESQAMLEKIYEKYGWPGPQIVGRDGAEACFWLGLSSYKNSKFQYQSAMLMKDSLPKGEMYGIEYAITIDRWLCLSYKPTIFGSVNDYNQDSGLVEFTNDVVNFDSLNKRRAEVGLPNFEEANKELRNRAKAQKWPEDSQEDWKNMKRKWAIKGGYISA